MVSNNQSGLKKKLREMQKPVRFKIIQKEFEEKTEREREREMQKPIWFEINKREVEE